MPPVLQQTAHSSACRYEARSVTATFERPTTVNNLVVLTAVIGGGSVSISAPAGFVHIRTASRRGIQVSMWYYQAAPAMESVRVTTGDERSIQVRVMEYSGAAQSNALDQVSVQTDESYECYSGRTGTIAQADEIVVAVVGNQHSSCSQSGFVGGLIRLFENVSPQRYGRYLQYWNDDHDRTRMTVHQFIARVITTFYLRAYLSSHRAWVAIICTFRGGTSGPARFVSTGGSSFCDNPVGGSKARLDAFGPMKSVSTTVRPMIRAIEPEGSSAMMFPFNYQYRMGSGTGILLGSGTEYKVESVDGLNGWSVRTSDADLPRGDGSLRGIDLESSRVMQFTLNVGKNRDQIELLLDRLYRALVPQRDEDWELYWRHPTAPAKMMRVRPIELPRLRNNQGLLYSKQTFALRAADPRHYSAGVKHITIPNTPSGALSPTTVNVTNTGNISAYPVITIKGASNGITVSRVQITNHSTQVIFDIQLTLPKESTLVGDMEARITGAPRSVITLDGQSRYGAWELPREPFSIDADPTGLGGFNVLSMQTVPAGAPINCTLDYRDTWSG